MTEKNQIIETLISEKCVLEEDVLLWQRQYNDLAFEMDSDFLEYYGFHQFDSRDAPGTGVKMDSTFQVKFKLFTELLGDPVDINSAFRTARHNRRVGGAKKSAHMTGHAVDIPTYGQEDRYRKIYAAIQAGFPRIGIGRTFIHIDNKIGDDYRVWLYPTKRK